MCELPHWSVCDFGVWLGLTHWKRLCYSLHVHTHRVSLLCVNANVSSGSPVWSRPLNSLQTEREKDTLLHWFDLDRPSLFKLVASQVSPHQKLTYILKWVSENKKILKVFNIILTVHLWGFSPVCLRMCTTNMYWALKGFCSLEHSSQRHTNSFFSPWMWSLFMCCERKRRSKFMLKTCIILWYALIKIFGFHLH